MCYVAFDIRRFCNINIVCSLFCILSFYVTVYVSEFSTITRVMSIVFYPLKNVPSLLCISSLQILINIKF